MASIKSSGADYSRPPSLVETGDLVALGPPRRDLVSLYHRWSNDASVAHDMGAPWPVALEAVEAAYAALVSSGRRAGFTIYDSGAWRPVGDASLDLDIGADRRRTAELTIRIGEASFRGRGYGTAATRLVLRHAFTTLALHSVMLTVAEFNIAARHAYVAAGFRECGRRREYRFVDGRWWDSVYMDCLAREFMAAGA